MEDRLERKASCYHKQITNYNPTPIFLLLLALILSCKTTPQIPDFALMTSVPLEGGASVYIFADVEGAAPVLNIFPIEELNQKQTKQMMDRTSFFAAALFPKESERRFQLISWGNYPNSGAGMALGMNKSWVKQNSKTGPYWHSAEDKLSLVIDSKQAFVASWLDDKHSSPVTPLPGTELPETFAEFRKDAPISLWVDDPGPGINRIFDNREIPFQIPARRLFANLYPGEEINGERQYHAVIRMQFSGSVQARGIASLFTMARVMFGDSDWALARFFFVNPPVQDGQNLDITTGFLSEKDFALLLQMILLNWT